MPLITILIDLLVINLISFLLFAADKRKARLNQFRIPEFYLLISAGLGGGVGALLAMLVFRHKTSKPGFYLKLIVIIAVQIVTVCWILRNGLPF